MMDPSAEARFDATLDRGGEADHFLGIAAIANAYSDGEKAERERIIAAAGIIFDRLWDARAKDGDSQFTKGLLAGMTELINAIRAISDKQI